LLEELRCLHAEKEASLLFASSLLRHAPGTTVHAEQLPGALQDAWFELSEASAPLNQQQKHQPKSLLEASKEDPAEFVLYGGQVGRALQTASLAVCLKRASGLSKKLAEKYKDAPKVVNNPKAKQASSEALLAVFDAQLQQLKEYHVRHSVAEVPSRKRQKVGHPVADGYDLASLVSTQLSKCLGDTVFTPDEVMGKYLDLQFVHRDALSYLPQLIPVNLLDFLQLLSKGLATAFKESDKLQERKKYQRFLKTLQEYLESFLERGSPLLSIKNVKEPAIKQFEDDWRCKGGTSGWEPKAAEATWVDTDKTKENAIDLTPYNSAEELYKAINADVLKAELSRLGLKCGGTPLDRAKRLFLTKDTPLEKLPKKAFAKTGAINGDNTTGGVAGERRVDLARQEIVVTALLDQLRPTLEATIRRAERQQAQTIKEQEQELFEELHGSELPEGDEKKKEGDEDESDEEDAPIYNPKGVPLGWDGKPIPYWLFKLHGLNHFYPCEICGGESYRGRRNFEKHFAEAKHAYGMKCLGIPNTKHFHGVTNIDDAQDLWKKLQQSLDKEQFDGGREEEYEDSHGNVLSRTNYEDLARQGLL
jgi:splicing factor 3A subunit 3